jgi:integrase
LRPILEQYTKSVKSKEGLLFPDLPSAVNLRQRFQRMLAKAGVKAWPKLFQNLRASFATDMVERFPTHTVASWCGHSVTIQQKAYMIARDSHFKAATAGGSILGSPSRDSAPDIASTAQNSAPHGIAPDSAESQSHP